MERLHHRWLRLGMVLLVVMLGGIGLRLTTFGQPTETTILVTTPLDIISEDGLCSLREAVQAANTNLPSGTQSGECIAGGSDDLILFSPDFITFSLSINGSYEDANQLGDFDILDSVIIQGNGITQTILDGAQLDRLFHVHDGTVRIENLAITNGRPQAVPFGAIPPGPGGAIYNEADLTLTNVALYQNAAAKLTSAYNHGIYYGGAGGALASTGDLWVQSSLIYSNTSGAGPDGGEYVSVSGEGGAIYSLGSLTISDTHIFNNLIPDGSDSFEVEGFGGNGGAISAGGTVAIYSSRLENNHAGNGSDSWFPQGLGARGGSGGAIYAHDNTTVSIDNTTISGNRAGDAGNPSGGVGETSSYAGDGGGIAGTSTSTFIIDSSTIDNNQAGAKGLHAGDGGGIYSIGTLTMTNSTVSANATLENGVNVVGMGSGIYANNASIRHSTIAYNVATGSTPIGALQGNDNRLVNVILANNSAANTSDCRGSIVSEGYNLILDTTNCTIIGATATNIYGQDPILAPLALEGYTTRTHAIDTASPALDAGRCFGISRDQRDRLRPVDHPAASNVIDACDMGAYERQDGVLPTITITPIPSNTPAATVTPSPSPTPSATPAPLYILVTTQSDTVANDGVCSLREAVQASNTDTPSGAQSGECAAGGANTVIRFAPDLITFTLSINGTPEDANQRGDLDVLDSVTIQGNGITQTVLNGAQIDRFFHILSGTVRIEALAITNSKPPAVTTANPYHGGAIYNQATLTLDTVALYGNAAGARTQDSFPNPNMGGDGGAIGSVGTLQVESSLIYSNTSGTGPVLYSGSGSGRGGGIYSNGTLVLSDTRLFNNRTPDGAIANDAGGYGGNGGAIYASGSVTIDGSVIENNKAGNGGNATTPNARGGNGGSGGGIYAPENTTVTLRDSTLSGNRAGDAGTPNGVSIPNGGDGGGIAGGSNTTVIILNSTIDNNHAGAGGITAGDGGGIYSPGFLSVNSSTISANHVTTNGTGGGIYANNAPILNSTIAFNSAATSAAGLYGNGNRLSNVILAHNNAPSAPDCDGSILSQGYNLIMLTPGCTISGNTSTNLYAQDPLLAPLALDGGTTRTHALNMGSPALDAGNCFGATQDQRHLVRPIDHPTAPNVSDGCDMGAYERQLAVPPTAIPPTATPQTTPTATPQVTPSATPQTTPSATPQTTPSATPQTTPSATATPPTTPTRSLFLPIIRHTAPTP